jgi:hypothetical protein
VADSRGSSPVTAAEISNADITDMSPAGAGAPIEVTAVQPWPRSGISAAVSWPR